MKPFGSVYTEGSKFNQIICAILINLPVFALGASIGWMSPMTLLLQSKEAPRKVSLTDYEISWMAAIPYLIGIPGIFLMAFLGDKIGPRKTLLLTSATSATSWILLLFSFDLWSLILARAFVGMLMAGCYSICPIYINEISEDSTRKSLGCLIVLFHTTGNLLLYVIGDIFQYRTILWICLSFPTFHLILFMMMPDSPSHLVKIGQKDEAVGVICWLRCKKENNTSVKEEIDLIDMEQNNNEVHKYLLFDAIRKDKILSKAFYIVIVMTIAREICGTVPILNFAGEIFKIASTNSSPMLTPNQETMLLGVVQVAGSSFASIFVDKIERKWLLVITALLSGLSMLTLASWFVLKDYELFLPNWIPITTLCISIFCDFSGLQPVSIMIIGEIFSDKYRGFVMITRMALSLFTNFLQLVLFKHVAKSIGIHISFYIFGATCVLLAIFVIKVIPETKGKTLNEVYKHFCKNMKSTESCVNN